MKKVLLTTLNSKFSHQSLALEMLSKYQDNYRRHDLLVKQFTINQPLEVILREIFLSEAEYVFFSCYIWNIEETIHLLQALKKMRPQIFLGVGGPEVSYDAPAFLENNPECDLVMCGEGEEVFTRLLDELEKNEPDLARIPSICYRQSGEIVSNPLPVEILDMATLPFPYENDLSDCADKIIYYESSRGCPYACAYCLSSIEKTLRFRPLEQVYQDLERFLAAKPKQVKFIDRTFNAKRSHALAIWQYIKEHDNGATNFHFEITADILSTEMLFFLQTVRPGLMQFEIGIQSTNPETIKAINRHVSFATLAPIVQRLRENNNIHLHLDLIAGLPYEDYASFGKSFDEVYALKPHTLQLGFLKVLKGTQLYQMRHEYDIVYLPYAPYEVISTKFISAEEIVRLKGVEDVLEKYYNSGKFPYTLAVVLKYFARAFSFYEAFGDWWLANGLHLLNYNTFGLAENIYHFCEQWGGIDMQKLSYALKFDLCLHEKPKKWPQVLENIIVEKNYVDFYKNKANLAKFWAENPVLEGKVAARMSHIAEFIVDNQAVVVLFDYTKRDYLGYARYHVLEDKVVYGL